METIEQHIPQSYAERHMRPKIRRKVRYAYRFAELKKVGDHFMVPPEATTDGVRQTVWAYNKKHPEQELKVYRYGIGRPAKWEIWRVR